ncbi:MAG TPA: RNA polymerase sigma factor [Bacteroidales bacterium]|nr:RNA polymerase sigma factor [Bacteroidales bacterium]
MSSHSENQKTLSQFFAKEYHNLVSFVKRYWHGDEEMDADDIVQDVVLNLYTRVDFTTPIENLLAYTYRSLKNRVIDRQRKKKNRMLSDFEDEQNGENYLLNDLAEEINDEDDWTDPEVEIAVMYELMEELSPDQQEIIIKTEIEGFTFEELSQEWDIPIGTLLSRKHRGMAKLQKLMTEYQELKNK